jgi:hypothetical protein
MKRQTSPGSRVSDPTDLAIGIHPSRSDEHRNSPLLGHDTIVGVPVVVRPASRREDPPQQQPQSLRINVGMRIVRASKFCTPFHGHPLPTNSHNHRGLRTYPQVTKLARTAPHNETHHRLPSHWMLKHSSIDHRRLDRAISPQRRNYNQAMLANDQPRKIHQITHERSVSATQQTPRLCDRNNTSALDDHTDQDGRKYRFD